MFLDSMVDGNRTPTGERIVKIATVCSSA